jgi:acyl-CoA thioester hydrolase
MSEAAFARTFHVRWGDMDFNAHMRNTAYLDLAADVRMMFFQEQGFSMRDFERLRIGPVILRDELDYYREMHLLETVTVHLEIAGMTPDGARFRLRNDFFREGGRLVARVTSNGAWLDLTTRKLVQPPEALLAAILRLPRSKDFQELAPQP